MSLNTTLLAMCRGGEAARAAAFLRADLAVRFPAIAADAVTYNVVLAGLAKVLTYSRFIVLLLTHD